MSLTQAITLNEDGSLFDRFSSWSERSVGTGETIFKALCSPYTSGEDFNSGLTLTSFYKISDRYHFVPAVEDLYWID